MKQTKKRGNARIGQWIVFSMTKAAFPHPSFRWFMDAWNFITDLVWYIIYIQVMYMCVYVMVRVYMCLNQEHSQSIRGLGIQGEWLLVWFLCICLIVYRGKCPMTDIMVWFSYFLDWSIHFLMRVVTANAIRHDALDSENQTLWING